MVEAVREPPLWADCHANGVRRSRMVISWEHSNRTGGETSFAPTHLPVIRFMLMPTRYLRTTHEKQVQNLSSPTGASGQKWPTTLIDTRYLAKL